MHNNSSLTLSKNKLSNAIAETASTTTSTTTSTATTNKYAAAALAASVGIVLLFAAGFAETSVLHNAAHDSRHAAVFPCH
ncbi:MAG: CbtB-domain containing protein [Ectothiorhodospiraceae bacterium]|nr:CbtB-domain containing protein [Ectothiorhodospiraceae bacterium]